VLRRLLPAWGNRFSSSGGSVLAALCRYACDRCDGVSFCCMSGVARYVLDRFSHGPFAHAWVQWLPTTYNVQISVCLGARTRHKDSSSFTQASRLWVLKLQRVRVRQAAPVLLRAASLLISCGECACVFWWGAYCMWCGGGACRVVARGTFGGCVVVDGGGLSAPEGKLQVRCA
jgi:hypothetical protein